MIDHNLFYYHLAYPMFSDTMFASTVSRRNNRCAQVYATDFRWARAFPMVSRSEVHKTLPWLFTQDVYTGWFPTCICDNEQEINQSMFYYKLKDAS